METVPVYWKTTNDDIERAIENITIGKIEKSGISAGKRPIHLIFYGKHNQINRTANLSSALGGLDKSCYADKSKPGYRPTILLVGCVHGGEFEGTAALLNLIHILETGKDLKGEENPFLHKACEKVNILIIPCLNPDGRNRLNFQTMVGKTFEELRYYNQGTWKDGSLCGWPDCKKIHPIKDHCGFLGGYFNDDGVNLMHDNFFGEKASETQFLFDVVEDYAPDFTILLHGGADSTNHLLKPAYSPDAVKNNISLLDQEMKKAFDKENFVYTVTGMNLGENMDPPCSFNLISALYHICGEPCVTYESNQGLSNGRRTMTHDEIYKAHMILFEKSIKHIRMRKEEADEKTNS